MLKVNVYAFTLTLIREMLGTNPMDPDIHGTHVVDKERKIIMEKSKVNTAVNKYLDAKDISEERKQEEIAKIKARAEELSEIVGELDEKGVTVFFREDDDEAGNICIGDHMVYGYMKAAAESISKTYGKGEKKNGTMLQSASYTQSIINQHARCEEQFIMADKDIKRKPDGSPNYKTRALRAKTAEGLRVAIAKSERLPAGTTFKFNLRVPEGSPLTEEVLRSLFAYGEMFVGLGQWRNAGFGLFKYTMEKVK